MIHNCHCSIAWVFNSFFFASKILPVSAFRKTVFVKNAQFEKRIFSRCNEQSVHNERISGILCSAHIFFYSSSSANISQFSFNYNNKLRCYSARMSSNFNGEEFKNSFCAPPPAAPDPPRYQAADSLHSNANIPPPPMYFPPKVHSNSDKSHETLMNHSAHAPKATSEQLLANVLATINEQRQKQPMVQIAKDPCYCEKVNSAILRSFAYIERKDRIAAGLLNGTTSADVNTNSAAELDLAYKRKKFANLLSNKKTNGIGVSNYSNDTKCADALAVYVDGLPFDYGENDLSKVLCVCTVC